MGAFGRVGETSPGQTPDPVFGDRMVPDVQGRDMAAAFERRRPDTSDFLVGGLNPGILDPAREQTRIEVEYLEVLLADLDDLLIAGRNTQAQVRRVRNRLNHLINHILTDRRKAL